MPPIRQLAKTHGLSLTLASDVVRDLVAEGVLYTQPGAGTFVGRPTSAQSSLFLMVLPHEPHAGTHLMAALSGFEERLAQLGANSISLDRATATDWIRQGQMPSLSGVFELTEYPAERLPVAADLPRVVFGNHEEGALGVDRVLFDDVDGGRQATQHLLRQGHRRIAFLGLHNDALAPGRFHWSANREAGWQSRLDADGIAHKDLAYHPCRYIDETCETQAEAAFEASRLLVQRTDVTAVVAANKIAMQGMFDALRTYEIDRAVWPVVVCFDSIVPSDRYSDMQVATTLRLPWDEIGHEAANMLWSRSRNAASGAGRQQLVRMRLIPRLTCRRNWATETSFATV
jgi:DNA-binding LacI/PurR family transcriptional regulator